MSWRRAALIGLALGVAAEPLPAQQAAAPAAAIDPARRALGRDLAQLLNSEAMTIAMLERTLVETMPKAMLADPNVKALEEAYPGVLKAMIEAMTPILTGEMRAEMPRLWTMLGDLYAENLNEADLRAALAFYGSPTGRRIIDFMGEKTDLAPMIDQMVSSGDYTVTEQGIKASATTGASKMATALSPSEVAETTRFALTPEGKRIVALTPRVHKLVTEWSNAPTPELDAKLDKAIAAVIAKYTGQKIDP
jgi:hypothetical protein